MFMRVDKDLIFVVKSEIKFRPNTFVNTFVSQLLHRWELEEKNNFFEEACMTIIEKDHLIRSSKRFNYSEERAGIYSFSKKLCCKYLEVEVIYIVHWSISM